MNPELDCLTPPRLETPRLLLRSLNLGDMEFICEHYADMDVTRYLLDDELYRNFSQMVQPNGSRLDLRWGLTFKETGRLVGTCGFSHWDQARRRAEISYDLSRFYWGKGLMKEALTALLNFGFDRLDLHRVEALVYVENTASCCLLERLGFQREGCLRDYYSLRGSYYDHFIYSLLKTERKLQPSNAV